LEIPVKGGLVWSSVRDTSYRGVGMIETGTFARLRAYRMGLLGTVLGILVTVSLAGPADAKTLTVNSTQDFSDVFPGDGVCDTIAVQLLKPCTLRGAIQEANSLAGMDVIYFDIPGGGVRTIEPDSQLPAATQRVTIDG